MHAFLKGGSLSAPGKDKPLKEGKKEEKRKRLTPWVEKYRPQTIDDVAHQDEVVAVLKKSLQRSDLPNLLFYGPPGTGKTSTILAAARELFGSMYRDRTLELNSSDERGINVIRDKVKKFAQLAASGTRPDGKPCPPFKIIILDECDSMTSPAQSALRRMMEKETKTTRFCLICNYVTRIIEPITSRCAKFRFKPLGNAIMETRLREICEKENVTLEDGVIETILETSEGDMRKAITSLQSAARLKMDEPVTVRDVLEITGVVPDDDMQKIITACYSDSYEKLDITIKEVIYEGYSGMQVLIQLHDIVVSKTDISDKQKSAICERISVCDKRLMDGADEYLQIMDLCTVMMQQICHGQK